MHGVRCTPRSADSLANTVRAHPAPAADSRGLARSPCANKRLGLRPRRGIRERPRRFGRSSARKWQAHSLRRSRRIARRRRTRRIAKRRSDSSLGTRRPPRVRWPERPRRQRAETHTNPVEEPLPDSIGLGTRAAQRAGPRLFPKLLRRSLLAALRGPWLAGQPSRSFARRPALRASWPSECALAARRAMYERCPWLSAYSARRSSNVDTPEFFAIAAWPRHSLTLRSPNGTSSSARGAPRSPRARIDSQTSQRCSMRRSVPEDRSMGQISGPAATSHLHRQLKMSAAPGPACGSLAASFDCAW